MSNILGANQQQQDADRVKAVLLEMQTAAFGHARTYTTVVIFGGYAGLFAIWNFVRDDISARTSHLVGLLIGISLLTFVSFEIFGMIIRSIEFFKVRNMLVKELPPAKFLAERERLTKESNFLVQKVVIPVWVIALVISVVTGIGAAIILLFTFSNALSVSWFFSASAFS